MSALQQRSRRHSADERDEMRTGGGLSFNEEWSSPVDLSEHSQHSRMGDPTLLPSALNGLHTASKTIELDT